jgi:hypothetical protein
MPSRLQVDPVVRLPGRPSRASRLQSPQPAAAVASRTQRLRQEQSHERAARASGQAPSRSVADAVLQLTAYGKEWRGSRLSTDVVTAEFVRVVSLLTGLPFDSLLNHVGSIRRLLGTARWARQVTGVATSRLLPFCQPAPGSPRPSAPCSWQAGLPPYSVGQRRLCALWCQCRSSILLRARSGGAWSDDSLTGDWPVRDFTSVVRHLTIVEASERFIEASAAPPHFIWSFAVDATLGIKIDPLCESRLPAASTAPWPAKDVCDAC